MDNSPVRSLSQIHAKQDTLPAQICGITFKGNAASGKQQDAMYVVDGRYYSDLAMTAVFDCVDGFCVAVSDGVASSPHAGACANAVIRAIASSWQQHQADTLTHQLSDRPTMMMQAIHEQVAQAPSRYSGASATLALVYRPWRTAAQVAADRCQPLVIKHVGDSRVYRYRPDQAEHPGWQCLTRDHNVLNLLVDQQAAERGVAAKPDDYNRDGMAGSYYTLTECMMINSDPDSNPVPAYHSQTLPVQAGDVLLVCTDGIHDLVPAIHWPPVTAQTDLRDWLKALRQQVYRAEGNAYDNGSAIVLRF